MDHTKPLTGNQAVLNWIDEMAKMTQPDKIIWIDPRGS